MRSKGEKEKEARESEGRNQMPRKKRL